MLLYSDSGPALDVSRCLLYEVGQLHFRVLGLTLIFLGGPLQLSQVALLHECVALSTRSLFQDLKLVPVSEILRCLFFS